jgi:hypothetical protein
MVSTLFETKPMHVADVSLAALNAEAKIDANAKTVDMAMSVAQADAVLAKYGYADRAEVAVA